MPADDFNQRELVPGSLFGVRRFGVDSLGRLTGVSHEAVWTPGVNEAKCNSSTGGSRPALVDLSKAARADVTYDHRNRWAKLEAHLPASALQWDDAEPDHRCGSKNCSCGYYAFFSHDATGRNHGYGEGQVTAIIEGTGVATVGRKGFRSERAEIVALVKPEAKKKAEPEKPKRRKIDWLAWKMKEHDTVTMSAAGGGIVAVIASLVSGIVIGSGVSPWFFLLLAGIPLFAWLSWSGFREIDLDADGLPNRRHTYYSYATTLHVTYPEARRPVPWDLITRNYPDVPVYPSIDAALAAHPLSEPPPKPSPQTHGEDFWAMEATS